MKRLLLLLFLALPASPTIVHSQQQIGLRVCTYNVLHLGDNDGDRAGAFRTVLGGIRPDVLACQEVNNPVGIQMLLDSALNDGEGMIYRAADFNDGPDTDNALFYNTERIRLIGAVYHPTPLRDIAEYILLPIGTEDTLVLFSMHLKAGDDSESEAQRGIEGEIVRRLLEQTPDTRHFIVAGDLNVYSASEPAYQQITDPSAGNGTRNGIDPINRSGAWHDRVEFADVHTQSTRGRQFGGGLHGGMDDQFDFLLISPSLSGHYQEGSYTPYGNDGDHFNDSINAMPNSAVPQEVAQALHDASDHLPVYLDLHFQPASSGVSEGNKTKKLPMGIW